MDPLEDRVRHLLSDDSWRVDVDTDSALTKVHAGAKRRRVRRTVGMAAVAALVVAGGAGGVGYLANVLPGQGRGEVTVATDKKGDKEQLTGDSAGQSQLNSGESAPGPESSASSEAYRTAAAFSAVSFTAAGPDAFWVLGVGPKATGEVRSTDDGGKSFGVAGSIPAPVAAGTNQQKATTVTSLRFARDGINGWAYGRALFATHDGGGTWTKVPELSGKVERLEIASGRAVALVDDGGTWSAWATPVKSDDWEQLNVELSAPGDLAVVGSNVLITDTSGDGTLVAASSDGGDSFDTVPTECSPDLSPGTLSVTADSAWLTCPTGTQASIFVSHNGGRGWDPVSSDGPVPNVALLGARTSSQTIVAVQGQVTILSDNGAPKTVPIAGLAAPTYAGFTNEKVGYVLDVDGKLFRTTDGGQRWAEVRI